MKLSAKYGSLISRGRGAFLTGLGKPVRSSAVGGEPAFYFPDFFLSDPAPFRSYESYQTITREEAFATLPEKRSAMAWDPMPKSLFQERFRELQERLAAGELQKAVPYIMVRGKGKIEPLSVIRSMLAYEQKHPVHLYGFWEEDEGMLGVTPELLFRKRNRRIETVACAGTCQKGADYEAFLHNPKETAEHQFVVDGIGQSLAPFGTLEIGERAIVEFSHLSHLVTPISLEMKEQAEPGDIARALHPTPALGTYPAKEGRRWLEEYEKKVPRGRFGAPVGYSEKEGEVADFFVGIRNVQWKGDEVKIGVGCGVLKESSFESEWDELKAKFAMTREALGL